MGSGCGPCFRCSFPLCCHPQFQILRKLSQEPVATAMPSAVTPRQLTLLSWPERIPVGRGGKKKGQEKEVGLGRDEGVDHTEDTHRRLRTYTPVYRAVCSYTMCYNQANKNKLVEEHLCMAYNHHPRDWPKNNVLGKIWLVESSYNCFHPGAMVGLRVASLIRLRNSIGGCVISFQRLEATSERKMVFCI